MLLLCKQLIAEAWDAGGLYQVGMFPHWGIWSEWNGKVSNCITRIKCFYFNCLRHSLHETCAFSRSKRYGRIGVTVYKGFMPNMMSLLVIIHLSADHLTLRICSNQLKTGQPM